MNSSPIATNRIAVVIPAFKVRKTIIDVVKSIGPEITSIIVVDDFCPEHSGNFLADEYFDPRLEIIIHKKNSGVGAAVISGYKRALEIGCDIVVKIDGDGQMDTTQIQKLIRPILSGQAGYTKGNRFFDIRQISKMPRIRIFGNLVLSFFGKFSTGYWDLLDPTNGFTAIHRNALDKLPLEKLDPRFFFESDILFRLNLAEIKIIDIPLPPIYGDEVSNLNIFKIIFEFPFKHLRNFMKRIAYNYYIRDFNLGSIELPLSLTFLFLGGIQGGLSWVHSSKTGIQTPTGTVVLVAVLLLAGLQLLLSFLNYDISKSNRFNQKNSLIDGDKV
jgi:glycosyltransferase involved in cell wall biosynthesis